MQQDAPPPTAAALPLQVGAHGTLLGQRYELQRVLGQGGMGTVYLARDTRLDRWVAIKTIHPQYLDYPTASRRFLREAKALARLDHPNVLTLYDSGQDGDTHYLVMQVGGRDLAHLLRQQTGPLPLLQVLRLALGVCGALAYAHLRGVIHRDLKSANILVGPPVGEDESVDELQRELIVKVTDFGLARFKGDVAITVASEQLGTPQYMSPEQILGQDADERSDLYSFGVLLFEIATGEVPFKSGYAEAILYQQVHVAPPRPSTLRPDLPLPLEALILRLLEKEPSRRPASAAEVLMDLQSIVATVGTANPMGSSSPRAAVLGGVAVATPTSTSLAYASKRTALVGRTEELSSLRMQFDEVASSRGGRLVLISGEPGVGKTRLAQELGLHARLRGGTFFEGRYLSTGSVPYEAWIDVLRAGVRGRPREELAQVIGPFGPEISQLLPELTDLLGPFAVGSPRIPADQRRRLFDGVTHVLRYLAEYAPFVVLLGDLQWAPDLSLLSHVARQLESTRVLLIGTYREAEFKEQATLVRDEAELNRARLAVRMPLRALNEAETCAMVTNSFGEVVGTTLGSRIFHATRGNAFFIEEMLRSLADRGVVRHGAGGGWEVVNVAALDLPDSVKLVIQGRVARLGEGVRDTLLQAAILGPDFSFSVLQELTGLDEDTLLDHIEHAITARVLVDRSVAGEERMAFLDDQLQEVLYDEVTPLRRRRYHLRAAQIIEARYPERVEDLARHFLQGNDLAKAADYAYRAGERNARLFNWTAAAALFQQAAAAFAQLPESDDSKRRQIDAVLEYAQVTYHSGDPGESLPRLAAVERIAATLPGPEGSQGDRLRLARIQYQRGVRHTMRGEYPEAVECYQAVLAVAPALNDPQFLAYPSMFLGRTLFLQGRFAQAEDLLIQAVGALEQVGDWTEYLWALGFLGFCMAARGRVSEGIGRLQDSIVRADELKNLMARGINRLELARVFLWTDEVSQAVDLARQGLVDAEESGLRSTVYVAHAYLAYAESCAGDHAAALEDLVNMRQVADSLGGRLIIADWTTAFAADVSLAAGQVEEALRLAEQAVGIAQAIAGIYGEGMAQQVWGRALTTLGPDRWDEAEQRFAHSLDRLEAGDARIEAANTRVAWGTLLLDRGDTHAAREHFDRAAADYIAAGLSARAQHTQSLAR